MNTESKYRGTQLYTLVLAELVTAAQYRGTTTYQQVAVIMGLPPMGNHMGREVGRILDEINKDEVQGGRPMLSAVVVNSTGVPSRGFYALAQELRRAGGGTDKEIWERERAAVYDAWKRPLPPVL